MTWEIERSVDEIDAMATLLGDKHSTHPSWYGGTAMLFGIGEVLWPLLVRVPKRVRSDAEPTPLTAEAGLKDLRDRLEFLIEKADNERGLSTPKARDQVSQTCRLCANERDRESRNRRTAHERSE